MYMVKLKTMDDRNILVNPKEIRLVKECENQQATIEFLSGSWEKVKCFDFDDLEQKFLDASMPEIDLKSLDGIKVYVVNEDK